MKWLFIGDTGGRDSALSLLRSPRTELFEQVELYFKDSLEMVSLDSENGLETFIHQRRLEKDSALSLFTSPGTELFESIECYSKDGFEMVRL